MHQSALCTHFIFLLFCEKTTWTEKSEKTNFTPFKDKGKFVVL